jgi:hypothetical protein
VNRNYIGRRIKRHGAEYIIKHDNQLQPFYGYLKGSILMVAAIALLPGQLIAPLGRPDREFIVGAATDKILYEEYTLLKVNCRGTLTRFDNDGIKDTFGRPTSNSPATIYSVMPLHLHTQDSIKETTTPDRSAAQSTYKFAAPTGFTVRQNDRLQIGGTLLNVTTITLAPDGLTSFTTMAT